ncbi:DUF2959 domain-containing protein [Puniceicoccales bacterium CK1056]|uniref:DUF2959 domain-containing protein n=1 Tax=Oceanipulchritudo coccoides TaxID=2706888 RepID=A0A6B2M671_9BACT|nr:DUF2959 domain-containing protein [Oceanipulchritudo coccoides]NDV63160.1 DUF2959 domain-containing protein [Oceanipulchritudo coccoides]
MNIKIVFPLLLSTLVFVGCQSAYYKTMEKFGVEKRDILVDRVEEGRDAQQETKEEFTDALEQFTALVNFEGGELEEVYDSLRKKFESSEAAAANVREGIRSIESVSQDLFREWESEIEEYTSDQLRRKSREALILTRESYAVMMQKMRAAEASMYPVLDLFRDQVLFLKHNLNARAIASLDTEAGAIASEVKKLVAEMEASIAEADAFIASMR